MCVSELDVHSLQELQGDYQEMLMQNPGLPRYEYYDCMPSCARSGAQSCRVVPSLLPSPLKSARRWSIRSTDQRRVQRSMMGLNSEKGDLPDTWVRSRPILGSNIFDKRVHCTVEVEMAWEACCC